MKRGLIFAGLLAVAFIFCAAAAKADSCPAASTNCTSAGGVSYTFMQGGSDGGGTFDVILTINTIGATASGTLNSFSVQFTGSTALDLDSFPSGTGTWDNDGKGPNSAKGCKINGSANHWCIDGGTIGVTKGGAGGIFVFELDVTGGGNPTESHIQAFQGQGDLAISNDVGVGPGGPPPSVPEPASLTLLGLGLVGVPFLRRRK